MPQSVERRVPQKLVSYDHQSSIIVSDVNNLFPKELTDLSLIS